MTSRKEDGYNKLLPTRIRAIMDKRNMKINDLAGKSGVSRQSIGYYANGSNVPNAEILAKIAKALDVSADYLLGLSNIEKREEPVGGGFIPEIQTCADAIRLIDDLELIGGTVVRVTGDEECGKAVEVILSDAGVVKYYDGREKMRAALQQLPDSLDEAAWQFQRKAREKLLEEAEKTVLEFKLPF